MRNLKKFLALVLAMVMAFSLMLTANAANSFPDSDSIDPTFAEAVDVLDALGVFQGDEDTGAFRPTDYITRGEVAAVIYRIATADVGDDQVSIYKDYNWFSDVVNPDLEWFTPYVNFCANAEYIKGVGGGEFRPYDNITGYEVLAMILRVVGYDQNHEFEGTGWSIRTAAIARREGVLKNINEGTLGGYATRQVVAELIFQAMQIPTVTYTMLQNYQKDVLVAAATSPMDVVSANDINNHVYNKDIYNTLMYSSFDIVGKVDYTVHDGTYGRPATLWVKDNVNDTIDDGTKFVPNHNVGTYDIAKHRYLTTADSVATRTEGMGTTSNRANRAGLNISMVPDYTFYTEITECELTKQINRDNSIDWDDIKEYVNGNLVEERPGNLDALHTTVATVNNQGRTLEIYKNHAADAEGDTWTFVYFDTLLGVVKNVIPRTFDTAGHVNTPAELWVEVNDQTNTNDTMVKAFNNRADYTYKVGDLVLLTTYGMKNETQVGDGETVSSVISTAINNAVPIAMNDFKYSVANDGTEGDGNWAVNIVGAPTQKVVTINATVGTINDKTGLIGTDGVTYPANWVYHYDGQEADQADHFNHPDAISTVPNGYDKLMKNEMIGSNYTLLLDKNNNVVGMTQGTTVDVGVVVGLDTERVGTGKWVMELEMFMVDGSTKTVRFMDEGRTYFAAQTDADDYFGTANHHENVGVGALLKIASFTMDGNTYWEEIDMDASTFDLTINGSAKTFLGTLDNDDQKVIPGVSDTLKPADWDEDGDGTADDALLVGDDTVFIIAEYEYRYNQGTGTNVGGNVGVGYKVYNGFKTIPSISSNSNAQLRYQVLSRDGKYVMIDAADPNNTAKTYSLSKLNTINVDDSYLLIAPIATYADHAAYKALKNGQETTLNVSNLNAALNDDIETALADNELIWITGTNTQGYVTDIEEVSDIAADDVFATYTAVQVSIAKANVGELDSNSPVIPVGTTLEYNNNGVLTIGGDEYLTVATGCTVQIVNKTTGVVHPASLANIKQYKTTPAGDHAMVFELNAEGFVCNIYIMD